MHVYNLLPLVNRCDNSNVELPSENNFPLVHPAPIRNLEPQIAL